MRLSAGARRALPLCAALVLVVLLGACGGTTVAPDSAGASWSQETALQVARSVVSDSPITALHFYDQAHGWAVGGAHDAVEFSATSDGRTWHTTTLPIRGRATDVEFVDKVHGWIAVDAAGKDGCVAVLRTSNGGRSWGTCRIPGVLTYEGGFSFTSPREGWFVGASADDLRRPVVLRTGDGGATWDTVHVADGLVTLTSVVFQEPPLRGWVSGYDNQHAGAVAVAFTTADGGRTWTRLSGGGAPQSNLVKVDDSHVWAMGDAGHRLRTLRWDALSGDWQAVDTGAATPGLFDFGSDDAGWGIRFDTGAEGAVTDWRLLATTDGGRTWKDTGAGLPEEPTAICCPTADVAVVGTVAGSVITVHR